MTGSAKQSKTPTRVFLGLGSNLEDRKNALNTAIKRLHEHIDDLTISDFFETDPVGITDQPKFLNAACSGETELNPRDLLDFILAIEKEIGRVRTIKWGPRVIDIDILFYGDRIIREPDLTIPHPFIAERGFVLLPLSQIAGDFLHPVLQKTVSDLLRKLPERPSEKVLRV